MTTLEAVQRRAESDAKTAGCFLNPDPTFLKNLFVGLKENEERYSYPLCPCRLATGIFEQDRDIVCPCDYRDPDVEEFGNCYCALYVRKDIAEGKTAAQPIPERRPVDKLERVYKATRPAPAEARPKPKAVSPTKLKLWYCKQCGYVCFREEPPYVCPICKAKREMFAEVPPSAKD
jgi:ferredoxin-thioredoxin reductase catalytic chain